MKGDFSRNTFDKKKHFTSVRMQQGRVQLDADWNEQMDIIDNRIRVGSQDFIGGSGAPSGDPGYKITITTDNKDFNISKGRFYVQGVLIENHKDILYSAQTLPEKDKLSQHTDKALYLAYLDVWQQGISSVEEPNIADPALSGADTTVRIKNRAQVKLAKLESDPGGFDLKCETIIDKTPVNKTAWQNTIAASTGKLTAEVNVNANLKNQLYRIEIHDAGDQKKATFKWSRNNGALVSKIEKINKNDITISSINHIALNFRASHWVELTTNKRTLENKPGIFVQLQNVDGKTLTIVSWPTGVTANDFINGTIRQWDNNPSTIANNALFDTSKTKRDESNKNYIVFTLKDRSNLPETITKGQFIQLANGNSTQLNGKNYFAKIEAITTKTITINDLGVVNENDLKSIDRFYETTNGILPLNKANSFVIGTDGLQIKFSNGSYKTGDYWLIPTRAATNNIASAQYNFGNPQLPEGIQHYYAQLALIRRKDDNTWELAGDCHNLISALANKAYQSHSDAPADSVFVDEKGNTGIGITTPKSKLDVQGNANVSGKITTDSLQLGKDAIAYILFNHSSDRQHIFIRSK